MLPLKGLLHISTVTHDKKDGINLHDKRLVSKTMSAFSCIVQQSCVKDLRLPQFKFCKAVDKPLGDFRGLIYKVCGDKLAKLWLQGLSGNICTDADVDTRKQGH